MLFRQPVRLLHFGHTLFAGEKSALAALRKKTGYTFANCKKALEMHNNDLAKAETWLREQAQAQGWAKATKLEGRNTSQGLIGVLIQKNIGAMIEVNCETDFVARNEHFRNFVATASKACVDYMNTVDGNNITKIGLGTDGLKNLVTDDGKSLGDQLALMIGTVGENASLRRAICYKTPENVTLLGYTHPTSDAELPANTPSFGKYGTIAAFKIADASQQEIQKKLCQHIVGLNPLKIGVKGKDEPKANKDDEICLIYQEFLSDPELTVAEVLTENNLEVVDYHRFECGETERLKEPENAVNVQTESVNVTS